MFADMDHVESRMYMKWFLLAAHFIPGTKAAWKLEVAAQCNLYFLVGG